ncbi:GrpE-domain-containing protein [Pseudovirgaria hyperparasitica]|uniref:GrpE protein homolog n=1 Tax=Pseudovirgaria hyperparasitica TaxID=470096 RepID=A0A6A6VUF8_9PEZI|nr:GrpE-domain-containing protein [Pseudovirgaria hyperparasitica]KAF2752881.1 GrpE-domain-containing protein [Pseudovirgaria hyperparasitica]
MIQRTLLRTSRVVRPSFRPQVALRTSSPSYLRATQPGVVSRWYSEASESKKEDNAKPAETETKTEPEDPVKKELEARNKEVVELKDKYLRSVADFRNLQERTKREVSAAKDFALSRFSRDLIESIDNLDRALENTPQAALAEGANTDLANLHSGLRMTETILMGTLKKHGLERFDPSPEGEKFDPNVHEAIFMTPQGDKEDGTCFTTQQKGFKLNGRVIRAAKVGVVKNS